METVFISSMEYDTFSIGFTGTVLKKLYVDHGNKTQSPIWLVAINPVIPVFNSTPIEKIYIMSRFEYDALDTPSCFIYVLYPKKSITFELDIPVIHHSDLSIAAWAETYLTLADARLQKLTLDNRPRILLTRPTSAKLFKNPIKVFLNWIIAITSNNKKI
jgi:hypothetical protein